MSQSTSKGVSRRDFLRGSGAAVAASTVVASATAQDDQTTNASVISGTSTITLNVNGKSLARQG